MQQDYYSVLASVIMTSAQDNAPLRRLIYELARSKLRQQLAWQTEGLSNSERAQQLLELETAIEQIEADLAKNTRPHTFWNEQPRSCQPLAHRDHAAGAASIFVV